MTASAVESSLPANQSEVSRARRMFISTAPMPLTIRPARAGSKLPALAVSTPPATINARPATTTRRSPKRCPMTPPGSAKTVPGNIYNPKIQPNCA